MKESPEFIKTTLQDVKRASSIITQKINGIQLEIDQEQKESAELEQAPLKDLGTYDIPEWAVNYLENGDMTNLSDEEVKMVDDFVKEQFPDGFVMNVDWDNGNEFNSYPAFGERNEQALTNRGESPYLATQTYPVQFLDPTKRESVLEQPNTENEEVAAKLAPRF